MVDMPYFMENEEWFYFDSSEKIYKLTDMAPKKARDSYKEFYSEIYGRKKQGDEINENSTKQQK